MTVTNNLRLDTFGEGLNASLLSQKLLELGDAALSHKLKKKWTKTVTAIRCIENLVNHGMRHHITELILKDAETYLTELDVAKEIRDRWMASLRRQRSWKSR